MGENFNDPLHVTKRDYVRTSNWSVDAKYSKDNHAWLEAEIPNIAAGGLLMLADEGLQKDDEIWVDLIIDPILGPSIPVHIKAKAVVKAERAPQEHKHSYAVVFTDISQEDKIRLDELVRMTIAKSPDSAFEMSE
ncbi:MAG: PilZ domain-containing protein [Oscillospiraceae bacterium]|jgi:hypothetical protein|nr:PilZ domain-containing protein [Oscillospiraceae bacterium]